jgi:hypothetical protein
MYSTDISFGSKTVGDMMLFLENSQTNPYALGKDNITPYFRNIDIPFSGLYKKVLTTSHHQLLMSHVNSNYKETYGNAMNIYEVKANGSSNYIIDDISQPDILGSFAGIYVFDQSDSSNSGHILKFRNKSTQTAYEENVTYAGTPGTLNSFTFIEMDYSTPILEYYCENHSVAMYGEFKISPSYSVKVVTNIVGDSVYALSFPYSSVYYNQPDLSFGAGDYYIFDVSDPTMANYNLVFGTIADDATTINNSVVSETNGVIILDIPSGYSGSPLVLFDSSNANMGYIGYSSGVTPVVRLDFGLESDYTNLTNQVDGTQYTDISYTGGLSLNNDELEIAQKNNVTFSNLPPEQFTIMLKYKFTTTNQHWHGISFKQENDSYTVFMHINDNTQYKLTSMKQDSSAMFTFGDQGYPDERFYDIGTQYSFAYVKTDTSLNFFENQSLISSTSNDFSLNEFWVNREGNAAIFNTDIAIADVKIFDTAVDVPNYVDVVDNVTSYIVTVSNEVFYIDNVENPEIAFVSSNIYVFDQSDATNAGQQIVFGYTFDSSNVFVSTDGVQVVGTPGQPGAYTSFTVPSNPSGTIHYYSDGSANMGFVVTPTIVTVSNEVFYLDGSANPQIEFLANESYVFDQSDPTNEGQQIVFGYTFDDSANILTSADGVTVMGTPGRPGAYTTLDLSSSFVGPLYYYSDSSANMGYEPPDFTYSFTVKNNIYDEPVWALYDDNNSIWYNQPDLSFNAPYVYEFDVSDPSNNGYVLSFGTIVDVSDATIESSYVTRTIAPGTTDAKVLLDLRDYSGDSLVYFEDSSAGMGYVVFESSLAESFVVTSVLSGWPSGDLSYSVTGNGKSFVNGTYNINVSDPVGGGLHLSRALSSGSDGYPGYDYYSENGSYTNGTESGTHDTTTVSGATYNGSWIELSLPYKLQLNQLEIHARSSSSDHLEWLPKKVHFLGSNDGSNYYFLQTITLSNQLTQIVSIPNITDAFTTIRMVTETLQGTSSNATKINVEYWSIGGTVNLDVTVSGSPEVFYIDGSANPQIDFSANESYVFDQSDPTNAGQQIVFGYTPDSTTNILTSADGVTVMGTPGQPGAYTSFTASGETVYYYSFETPGMGYAPIVQQYFENTEGRYLGNEEHANGSSSGLNHSSDFDMPYDPGSGKAIQKIAIRYPSITTSKTTIQNATIKMHIKQTGSGNVVIKISGEKQGDSSAFTTTSYDITNRTKTDSYVLWDIPNSAVGEVLTTPDLSTIVQEIMDLPSWSSGNSICLIFERDDSTSATNATRYFYQDGQHVTIDGVDYETPLFTLL